MGILETYEMTRSWINGYVWNSKGLDVEMCVWILSKQVTLKNVEICELTFGENTNRTLGKSTLKEFKEEEN